MIVASRTNGMRCAVRVEECELQCHAIAIMRSLRLANVDRAPAPLRTGKQMWIDVFSEARSDRSSPATTFAEVN